METVYKNCPKGKESLDRAFWIDLRTPTQNIPSGVMKFIDEKHRCGLICKDESNIVTFIQEQAYDAFSWSSTWGIMTNQRWQQLDDLLVKIHESRTKRT